MNGGMRRLAAETGLSIATVSRALNDNPAVSAKTKQIVVEAAERIGYVPSAAARALATARTRTIGAVIPTLAHSIFSTFIAAIEETLAELGYALIIATSNGDLEIEERRAIELMDLGAEALIVSGEVHTTGLREAARRRGCPILCTSTYNPDAARVLPTIGYDNYELGRTASAFIAELGHEDVAVFHGPASSNDRTRLRLEGVRAGCANPARVRCYESELAVSASASSFGTMQASGFEPTAILCLSDVLALGVLFEAQRQGLTVPGDLSVMGFDNLEWASAATPPLTTIALPVLEMGTQAARALVAKLDHQTEIESLRLTGNIIVRASTAPID